MSANEKQVGGSHYREALQHWDIIVANNIPYLEAMALKYIMRHRRKNGKQDLEKAMHFLEKMVETYYPVTHPLASNTPADEGVCPNDSQGKHSWSHIYKYGTKGNMQDMLVCELCRAAHPA